MKHLITGICLLFSIVSFAGGPWPTGKGKSFLQIAGSWKSWDARFDGTYSNTILRDFNRRTYEQSIFFYSEIGLTDRLSFISNVPFRFQRTGEEKLNPERTPFDTVLAPGNLSGFGNVQLGMNYSLGGDKITKAIQIDILTNSASENSGVGLRTGYNGWGFYPSVHIGQGFENSYYSIQAGLQIWTNQLSENISANFQYGYEIFKDAFVIADIHIQLSLGNGTQPAGNFAQTALFIDNQGYVSSGLKGYWKFADQFSLTLAGYGGFAVINQGNQPGGIFVGFAYEN